MLIDWFTVGAQIINFIVLVWLLKRFLYKPILKTMDERERLIAANLQAAAGAKAEAEAERQGFMEKSRELERRQAELLRQAQLDANKEYQALLEKTRTELAVREADWNKAVQADREAFMTDLTRQTQAEVITVARQVLQDLAGADVEERMVPLLARQLDLLPAAQKDEFKQAIAGQRTPVTVRSAFPLSGQARQAVREAVGRLAGADPELLFENGPELVGGIELVAGGQKVAWTVAQYLAGLRQTMEQTLERMQTRNAGG